MNYVKQLSIALLVLGSVSGVFASGNVPPAANANGNPPAAVAPSYVKQAKDWAKANVTKTKAAIAVAALGGGLYALYNMNESFKETVDNGIEGCQDLVNDAKEGKNNAQGKLLAIGAVVGLGAFGSWWYQEELKKWWNE